LPLDDYDLACAGQTSLENANWWRLKKMIRILIACWLGVVMFAGCADRDQSEKSPTGKRNRPLPVGQDSGTSSVAGSNLGAAGGPVELDKLTLVAPAGWERRTPSSGFVLAEFYLPKAGGADKDGRLTVSTAGGDVEANIERWRSQFGSKPETESRQTIEADGLNIILVDYTGEFSDQRGPFAPATPSPGSRMLAAIIPVEGELYFVKAVGPQKTMDAHKDQFMAFLESVKKR
jgi:hypothetical protein